jgi:hypothetical protein
MVCLNCSFNILLKRDVLSHAVRKAFYLSKSYENKQLKSWWTTDSLELQQKLLKTGEFLNLPNMAPINNPF